jgi:hypothetical protein
VTPAPLCDRFLKLNHEHLSRRLLCVGFRGAHVASRGAELLEGLVGHPTEPPCAELIQIEGVFGRRRTTKTPLWTIVRPLPFRPAPPPRHPFERWVPIEAV